MHYRFIIKIKANRNLKKKPSVNIKRDKISVDSFEREHENPFCLLQIPFKSSRLEVFCKKSCSEKFRKIHRKTPVTEPLFGPTDLRIRAPEVFDVLHKVRTA